MYNVKYYNTVTKSLEYRRYKFMEIQQVRAISSNYAKRHNLQVVGITKKY